MELITTYPKQICAVFPLPNGAVKKHYIWRPNDGLEPKITQRESGTYCIEYPISDPKRNCAGPVFIMINWERIIAQWWKNEWGLPDRDPEIGPAYIYDYGKGLWKYEFYEEGVLLKEEGHDEEGYYCVEY